MIKQVGVIAAGNMHEYICQSEDVSIDIETGIVTGLPTVGVTGKPMGAGSKTYIDDTGDGVIFNGTLWRLIP